MASFDIGDCIVRVLVDADGGRSLLIERADERIRIADEFLEQIRNGGGWPEASFGENILTIRGANRVVSYGLTGEQDYERLWWYAVKSPEVAHAPDDEQPHAVSVV